MKMQEVVPMNILVGVLRGGTEIDSHDAHDDHVSVGHSMDRGSRTPSIHHHVRVSYISKLCVSGEKAVEHDAPVHSTRKNNAVS